MIMQDYLDYIYPMVPVVHRPSFLKALEEDQDCEDEGFLALTLSIAALVVATMANRFRTYQSHTPPLRFSSRKEMVHFCYQKILALRTASYYDELNFQKFAISYIYFAAFLQLGDHNWSRMVSVEAMQIARLLNLHRISEYDGLNCIETQLRKKGFWLVFYCYVHAHLQNLHGERLSYLDPGMLNSIDPNDLMPLEVDDEFIFKDEVAAPITPRPCLATGFIHHSRVFLAAIRDPYSKPSAKDPCPCVRTHDLNLQVHFFQDRLDCLRHLLIDIPSCLQLSAPVPNVLGVDGLSIEDIETLQSQFASMRANLHITHIWLQSLILDQLEVAQSRQQRQIPALGPPDHTGIFDQRALWLYREELCRQLFFILYNFPQSSLEANGLHAANKVRDIASSLLACPFHPEDPIAKRVAGYVQRSTDILSRLDSSEVMNAMHLQTWIDTDRISK
ncbi:hypothetical protein PENSUB_8752 [Penicillium subrubescens]|uniref:Xylanolytic transcriptional activator regulatory domain-containing protein n=1 Tax=Penicillium subrubescens TaxID=1316194 RepID=A0A1Q5TF67_9EURO|nr:hypothetical protein PENSUB_8752 [Penicillium subrubescens]